MVNIKCEPTGCNDVKTTDDIQTCIALMHLHQINVHHQPETRQVTRPTLLHGISEEEWEAFPRGVDSVLS